MSRLTCQRRAIYLRVTPPPGKQSLADVARRSSVEEIVEERAADLLIFDLDSGGSCSPSLSKGRQVREMLASSADFCDNWRASVNS